MLEPGEHFLCEKRKEISRAELVNSRMGKAADVCKTTCDVTPPKPVLPVTKVFSVKYLERTHRTTRLNIVPVQT